MNQLVGRQFGRLTVLKALPYVNKEPRKYLCVCDCGNQCIVVRGRLRSGSTRSCGCLHKDVAAIVGARGNARNIPHKNRLSDKEAAQRVLFATYKAGAHKRSLEWGLTLEHFCEIIHMPCRYCGNENTNTYKPANRLQSDNVAYNGIDRIDNNKGYVETNVGPCCIKCNIAKRSMTEQEFLQWVTNIYNYQRQMDNIPTYSDYGNMWWECVGSYYQ